MKMKANIEHINNLFKQLDFNTDRDYTIKNNVLIIEYEEDSYRMGRVTLREKTKVEGGYLIKTSWFNKTYFSPMSLPEISHYLQNQQEEARKKCYKKLSQEEIEVIIN